MLKELKKALILAVFKATGRVAGQCEGWVGNFESMYMHSAVKAGMLLQPH